MEFLKKYWFLITFVVTPLGLALVWIVSIDSKTFSSAEEKVIIIEHVKKAPTPEKIWKKYYKDSINDARDSIDRETVKKSRAMRDSLIKQEHIARKYADSINLLNADQLFQIKEELKQIKAHN
mgnify:CR=1 FL=1|jgi:hypothetical protein